MPLEDAGVQEPDADAQSPLLARQLSFASSKPTPEEGGDPVVPSVVASLSQANARKRVARLMQRKANGTYKVPDDLVKAWKDGDQDRLVSEFLDAGLDKDPVVEVPTFQDSPTKMKNLNRYCLACSPVSVALDAILFQIYTTAQWRFPRL